MQENGELELDFLQNAMKFSKILHMCYKVPQFLATNLTNITGIDKVNNEEKGAYDINRVNWESG